MPHTLETTVSFNAVLVFVLEYKPVHLECDLVYTEVFNENLENYIVIPSHLFFFQLTTTK